MNIKMTFDEFNNFVMLYLKGEIEHIDELIYEQNPNYYEFITMLKSKGMLHHLYKTFTGISAMERTNTIRIINEMEKSNVSDIRVLM